MRGVALRNPIPLPCRAMRLSQYLDPSFVVLRLSRTDVDGIVEELAEKAEESGVARAADVKEKLLERERQHPTVLGGGLAIPHATVPEMDGPVIGVALAPEPIAFGGEEMDDVRAFFVLLSPPGYEREHVKLLARICRLVRHENFLDRLADADDEEAVMAVITAVDDQHV